MSGEPACHLVSLKAIFEPVRFPNAETCSDPAGDATDKPLISSANCRRRLRINLVGRGSGGRIRVENGTKL
jgi:hypothetical protein